MLAKKLTSIWLAGLLLSFSTGVVAMEKAPPQVKMVVTAAIVSDKGMPIYDQIADYLSKKLNWDMSVVSGLSYDESDEMLDSGVIQIGYVCGLPYVHKFAEGKYDLLAMPIMSMKKGRFADAKGYEDVPGKYYSYTIVHKDSPINSWVDLKGKSYAFNETASNSGYNMPRYKLVQLGAKSWEDYFSKVVVSGTHEESIRLVAQGIVDASSVDSLVLDYDRVLGDADALNVKIIEHLHLGGAGIPPVVISKKADPSIREKMQKALLSMHEDPEGRKLLDKALVSHFVEPDDSNYDDIRMMEAAAKKVGFRDFEDE